MPNPRLRKLALTVFKDRSGLDPSKIAASGVDVTPYKRGAISDRNETLTAGAGKTLHLRDSTMLVVNDVLQLGTASGVTATVTAIPNGATATVTVSGGSYVCTTNARHVIVGPAGRVPTIYTDPAGIVSTSSLTTDSDGYAQCFLKERITDVLVGMSSGSVTASLREAETSGDDEIWINALNYATIQDAIDDCPSVLGNRVGTVFIPSGTWAVPTALDVDKSIRIVGDGVGSTVLLFDSSKNVDIFNVSVSNVTIENMSLGIISAGSGTGVGIRVGGALPIGGLTFRNLNIDDSPSWGIKFEGGEGGNSYISHSLIERATVSRARSGGCFYGGSDAFVISVESCVFGPTAGYGIHAKNPTAWEIRNSEVAPAANTIAILMELAGSGSPDDGPIAIRIASCDIETVGGSSAVPIHIKNGRDIGLYDNYIYKFTPGVHLEDCEGGVVVNNVFKDLTDEDLKLTDCTKVVVVGGRSMDDDEVPRAFRLVEAGTTAGTMILANGVIQLPRYATGSLPTPGSTTVRAGSIAFDTTTNTVKFVNNGGSWGSI